MIRFTIWVRGGSDLASRQDDWMPGAAVTVRGLSHRYRSGSGALTVLDDLNLDIDAGGYVAITGASGTGKSTLLSVLGGLDAPQQGHVVVDGRDLHNLTRDQLADFRRDTVGFVFQHFGLLDTLTAAENIALANTLTGERASVGRRKATELLASVGLADRADHQPAALSGGERQRVAIARALVNEPRVLLADEPTGNLDDESSALVIDLLETVRRERGCTLVLVTHDRRLAQRATQRYRLIDGRLHQSTEPTGPPEAPEPFAPMSPPLKRAEPDLQAPHEVAPASSGGGSP